MRVADSLNLEDYVVTFKNLYSRETCDLLLAEIAQWPETDSAWTGWQAGEAAVGHDRNEITDHRTCHFTMLTADRCAVYDRVRMGIEHINEYYPFLHKSHAMTGIQVMRYKPGHKFKEHIDHYSGAPRTLSIIAQLNQDYEGGQLSFWQGRHTTAMTHTGDAVAFPSNLCFPHQVEPITRGTRYSLVVWTQ